MWFAMGSIAFRECFEDFRTWNTNERKHNEVEGRNRWLTFAILLSEVILCWKYREGTGHLDMEAAWNTPFYNWGSWVAFHLWMLFFWLYLRFKTGSTTKYPIEEEGDSKIKNE